MAEHDEIKSQHFLKEIEQAIQAANREILNQALPPITRDNIMPLAISVARLRGQYLAEAFKIAENDGGQPPSEEEIETLKKTVKCTKRRGKPLKPLSMSSNGVM